MAYGAGFVAATQGGAAAVVDPRLARRIQRLAIGGEDAPCLETLFEERSAVGCGDSRAVARDETITNVAVEHGLVTGTST